MSLNMTRVLGSRTVRPAAVKRRHLTRPPVRTLLALALTEC